MRVKRIRDDNIRRFALVVLPADLIGNDIADLYCAERAGSLIWIRFRFFRLPYRILNNLERELLVISDLYRCTLSAIDHPSGTARALRCSVEHTDRQRHRFRCTGRNIPQYPGDRSIRDCPPMTGIFEGNIRIQSVPDDDLCCLILVIPAADLISDRIPDAHTAELSGALVRCRFLLVRLLRYRVLDRFKRYFMVISDPDRCARAAVCNLPDGLALRRHKRTLEYFHSQIDRPRTAGLHTGDRPCHHAVVHPAVVRRADKFHIGIQRIRDGYGRGFCLVILIADLIGDLITHLYRTEYTRTFVRSDFLLLRSARHRILNDFKVELLIISDLHRCSVTAVDHLARATLRLQSTLQDPDGQVHFSLFSTGYCLKKPCNRPVSRCINTPVRLIDKFYIRIQLIPDQNICGFRLVVPAADLIGDLIADSDRAQDSFSLIWLGFLLMRYLRYRILDLFQEIFLIISHLDGSSIPAVDNLAPAAFRYQCPFEYLYRKGYRSGAACRNIRQCPCDSSSGSCTVIRTIMIGSYIFYIAVKLILDYDIRRFIFVIFVADLISDLITDLNSSKCPLPIIRKGLFFVRILRNRILHCVKRICTVVPDFYGGSITTVDDLAGSVTVQCTRQNLYCQSDGSFLPCIHILQCPGDDPVIVYAFITR